MMKQARRILTVCVALIGASPVLGDTTDYFEAANSWEAIRYAMMFNHNVKLSADVLVESFATSISLSSYQDVTLDLNGHKLTIDYDMSAEWDEEDLRSSLSSRALTMEAQTSVDGSLNRLGTLFSISGTKLTVIDSVGGGKIDGNCSESVLAVEGGGLATLSNGGKLIINGGEICNFRFAYDEDDPESFVIGGIVRATDTNAGNAFTMNGGSIRDCSGAMIVGFYIPGGRAVINGGLFYNFDNCLIGSCDDDESGMFTLNGGVFKDVVIMGSGFVPGEGIGACEVGELFVVGKNATTAGGKLTGGTFYFDPSASEYSSVGLGITGVSVKQNTDPVTWEVGEAPVYVCEMGGTLYTSVGEAIKKATEAATTITLITNTVEDCITIEWTKNITLDLNGWVFNAIGTGLGNTAILSFPDRLSITVTDTNPMRPNHYFTSGTVWAWNQDQSTTSSYVSGGCIVGGLNMRGGTLTLRNVNVVGSFMGMFGNGGAIRLSEGSTCLIENCQILGCNAADHGGAVYSKGDLTLKNVTIRDCSATGNGGAIVTEGSTLKMNGGCHFENCVAGANGGAVYVTSGTFVMGGDVTEIDAGTTNSVCIENCKANAGCGGGICVAGGTLDMVCGTLRGNSAKASGGTGGYGGGLYVGQGTANIRFGVISGNSAATSNYDICNQGGQLNVGDGLFVTSAGAVETISAATGATKLRGGLYVNTGNAVPGFKAEAAGNTEIYGGVFMGVPSTIANVNVVSGEAVVNTGDTGNYTVVGQSAAASSGGVGAVPTIVLDAGTFTFDPSGYPYHTTVQVELGGTLITNATVPVTWTVMQPYKPIPSQPPTVQYATAAVYTNGVLSADGIVWSNQTATVVYTARKGHAFADGAVTATVTLDTTVSPATIPAGKALPTTTLTINPTQNVPRMVPYQGMLTDAAGQKYADGAHTIDLRIWNDAGGTARCLWGARYSVYVQNGRFSVLLGNPNAQDLGEADGAVPEYDKEDLWMVIWHETAADGYYLGITPRDDAAGQALETCAEITPRARILAAPFAFRAQRARYAEQSLEDFKVGGKLTVAGTTTVKGQLNVPATGTQQFGPIVMTAKDVKLAGATSPASSQPTLYTMANQLYLQSWGNTTFGSTAGNVNLSASSGRAVKVTGAGTFTSTLSANTIAGAGTTTVKGSPIVMKANSGQTKFTQDASNITIGDATNFKVTSPVFNARSSTADSWVKGTTVNFLSNGGAKLVLNGDKIVAEGGATHWNSSTGWDVPMTFQTVTVSLGGDVMESTAAILADKPNNNARFEWTVVGWHGRTSDGKEGYAPCRITLETENGLTRVRVRRNNEKGQDDKKNSWSLKITVCLMGINKSWCQWL